MEDYLWLNIPKPWDLEIQHLCFDKMQLGFVFNHSVSIVWRDWCVYGWHTVCAARFIKHIINLSVPLWLSACVCLWIDQSEYVLILQLMLQSHDETVCVCEQNHGELLHTLTQHERWVSESLHMNPVTLQINTEFWYRVPFRSKLKLEYLSHSNSNSV